MTKLFRNVLLSLLVAGFWACGEVDPLDTPDVPISDPDVCACKVDNDCRHLSAGNVCLAPVCTNCVCSTRPLNIPCDDNDPMTVNDHCTTDGVCRGVPSLCGDQICNSAADENCETCEIDCPCAQGTICIDGKCQVKGFCPNGICESDEDCETCPQDCLCLSETACLDGECVDCETYCTQSEKECGWSEGCMCGECPTGYQCDEVNHCYGSNVCGNGRCEEGENCKNCATDCFCGIGQRCNDDGVCEDCTELCSSSNAECGNLDGCICGTCPICYSCGLNNRCMVDCDCLCYRKECGDVGPCDCGSCPAGQDCNGGKCTENCESLCADTACGWNITGPEYECFCGKCNGCNVCGPNRTCVAGAAADRYEPNEFPETATFLGVVTDEDSASRGSLNATIHHADDWDFYEIFVIDTWMGVVDPVIQLTEIAQDKDLDLLVCYRCEEGELTQLARSSMNPEDSVFLWDMGIPDALCLWSLNAWGIDEKIRLSPVCSGGSDDSGTLFMAVFPIQNSDCGSSYKLSWRM